MRLKKEIQAVKNIKKIYTKNKPLIEENHNLKKKYESVYLQNKAKKLNIDMINEPRKGKENIQQIQNNHKIYKPSKKIRNNKKFENVNIPENNHENFNNKPLTIKTNNNINIGNNINIINNNITNNSNKENINNFTIKNNMMNDSEIIRDYNITNNQNNDDMSENNMNTINSIHYRKTRIIDEIGDYRRKRREKNSSMEQRHRIFTKEIYVNDNDLIKGENFENRNSVYTRPFKTIYSPYGDYDKTIENQTNEELLNENENKIYRNKCFYNKYMNDNNNLTKLKKNKKMLYNFYYNNDSNDNHNHINSLNNNEYYKNFSTNQPYDNKIQSNTINNFYKHRSPLTSKTLINNKHNNYLNYISNDKRDIIDGRPRMKGLANSMIMEDLKKSPFENNDYKKNASVYNTTRRSKNKIRITKSNNPRIIEYNLDLSDDDNLDDKYQKFPRFFRKNYFNKNLRTNYNTSNILNNYVSTIKRKKDLQKYYSYYTKDLTPTTNNQFNIYGNISKSNNSFRKRNKETIDNEEKDKNNNLMNTPNFNDRDKTPKIASLIATQRVKKNLNININDNINNNDEDNSSVRIVVNKKKPKNEMPLTSHEHQRKNSFLIDNNNIEICPIENINFSPIKPMQKENNDKLIFNNEDELVEYMNRKYEEEKKKKSFFNKKLRFTGFILCKKFKGKNLYEIRMEDDIDKINKHLKEESVVVNEKQVELKFSGNEKDDINNKIIEENKQLKLEKENMNKKDTFKNELITKLDKEKMKLYDEIKQLNKEIEELKKINNKGNEQIKLNEKKVNFDIENNCLFSIDSFKIEDENKNKNKTNEILNNIQSENIVNKDNVNNNDKKKNDNKITTNNLKEIEKLLRDKIKLEDIINREENINNIYFDDNKDIIDNEDIIFDEHIFMHNLSHPKINDLVEEDNSDNAI